MIRRRASFDRALEFVSERGVIHRREFLEEGLGEGWIARLIDSGHLERVGPGIYMRVGADLGAHLGLAIVAKRSPRSVFFGLTALTLHEMTSQVARSVEIAVERDTWAPSIAWPVTDVFSLSGASFSTGIEERALAGGCRVRVYSAAKTVADLFKFRNRFGLDVALEALRCGLDGSLFSPAELDACAEACRVRSVVRPYLEALS